METENKDIVSLFPYQIKNRKAFYDRDHPKGLNPKNPRFDEYWDGFYKKMVEGKWVDDNGTWVYMMPKLFFYVNYPYIADAARDDIHPDLRDNEWILFTYYLCCEGFSGFELDEEYTCHHLIKKYEKDPDSLDFVERNKIPESAKKADGTFKKFLEPWYYLTRHYLIENPPDEPLGHALYDNPRYNALIFSSRGVGKSYSSFIGHFLHEFLTGGIKRFEDRSKSNKRLLFAMGAKTATQLNKSLTNVKATYDKMPGKYKFPEPKDKKKRQQPYMGPFYKNVQGNWETGGEIKHIIKNKNQTVDTQGSTLQMFAITADRLNIAAGDRFRSVYVEEVGLLENAIDFYGSVKDSLRSEGIWVGNLVMLGTGGDINAIRQPKAMFENPAGYNIFGIPNYWKNPNKKVGLFISKLYALKDYKDPQGNTYMNEAYAAVMKQREIDKEIVDALSYDLDIMNNAVVPDEMLRPGTGSVLPKQEAQAQLNNIEAFDLFRKYAQIGKLRFDPLERYGVRWDKDMSMTLRPITEIKIDDANMGGELNKDGAIIIYEQPPEFIPQGLYWVLYDPCKKSGDGQSYHSILIYKYFYNGDEDSMQDTIVAEWIGRKGTLTPNYEEVIKLAKYFNATIFTETNTPGFIEWCEANKYYDMLEEDAYRLEMEIHGKEIKRNSYRKGVEMNDRKKAWALEKLREWLLEVRLRDKNGIPKETTINTIYSKRVLNEIIAHSGKKDENFDHISSLILLMVLQGKLKGRAHPDLVEEDIDEDRFDSKLLGEINYQKEYEASERCEFLQY